MDAADADNDAKLYKASGALLQELNYKLPVLVWHPGKSPRQLRQRVLDSKCAELMRLLDRFQEWPQLLDPCLASLVQVLTDGYLTYLTTLQHHYFDVDDKSDRGVSPLPRAICRLLNALCKVRGYKVIVRLLNSEPKYLAPMLSCLGHWSGLDRNGQDIRSASMVWEERYVMLLWLSHLMLAPFELATMSGSHSARVQIDLTAIDLQSLPGIAVDVLSLAFQQLGSPGKEREAASILLVRLALRGDMQACGLPNGLVDTAIHALLVGHERANATPYQPLGYLSLLYGILNAGSNSEVEPYLAKVFEASVTLATSEQPGHAAIRDSAPSRKFLLKIMRVVLTHVISLSARGSVTDVDVLDSMLEDGIQHFLDALSDKDTPVRMAAAKALSIIAHELDSSMSAEVVEAVLGSLSEKVLLEDPHTQALIVATDLLRSEALDWKRNVSGVDPLQWHGLMLTLAHLLFRRSPPPSMLPEIIQALILGLEFEQRSNVGTSVGVGVRDAACFGLWALARKYSTAELQAVGISDVAGAPLGVAVSNVGVLQVMASKLVISACLDPSGNIRRGSSAALQELIGRHPDTVIQGISIVQVVDYHAVARRPRAMTEVLVVAAGFHSLYHRPLLHACLAWRGARATDPESRRWAATAVYLLTKSMCIADTMSVLRSIHSVLRNLTPSNMGSSHAGTRHGLLLCLASALDAITDNAEQAASSILEEAMTLSSSLDPLTGHIDGRVTQDIELVMEAIAKLIGSVARLAGVVIRKEETPRRLSWLPLALSILNRCTVSSEKDSVVQASARAHVEVFSLLDVETKMALIETWLDGNQQKPSEFTCKGRVMSIGSVYASVVSLSELEKPILSYLTGIVEGSYSIETKVNAMESLGLVIPSIPRLHGDRARSIAHTLVCGLDDYTIDQRGDVGSLLRLQSLSTVDLFRNRCHAFDDQEDSVVMMVMSQVVKLAAERLNSVRFRAWTCLETYWRDALHSEGLVRRFVHSADVSSEQYYTQLLGFLRIDWTRKHILLGLVSGATAGAEDVGRACCRAFASYLDDLPTVERKELSETLSQMLLQHLDSIAVQHDRAVVPMLEFLSFMVDQRLFATRFLLGTPSDHPDIWTIMQKVHSLGSSFGRMEASVSLYAALLMTTECRLRSLDKLTRQLLHRWPKIRNAAADILFLDSSLEVLIVCDWNAPITAIKPTVLELRKTLGVAGKSSIPA